MVKQPRRLGASEIEALLALDVPARLATMDRDGYPHITPLWFVWEDGAFYMTSIADRPHLKRVSLNARAGVCIDIEAGQRDDGRRPNQQVRAVGNAELLPDRDAKWTNRITEKYVHGPAAAAVAANRAADERVVIRLRPTRVLAVAGV